ILGAFAALLTALTFMGSAGGVANVQKLDMTGSPVSVGVCANCHLNNAFNPSVDLKVLDGETPVTKYVPGQTYTLQVVVKASPNASTFGFQAVALNSAGIGQAGTFQN
ncbi:choice-of-anchor V domain-containing protein, partial [Arthrospira platensis SPKY1]|nr:choice-of-anchor V domain-containing protein [Arthrospira platensis SPKY1]